MAVEPTPPNAAADTLEEQLIGGRFEVEAILGRGGMGSVYRVRDRSSGRPLALKRLEPARASSGTVRSSFEREYTLLARLAHPRIIEVYDYGIDERSPYYTMELVEGADMAELAPLPYPAVCRNLREVATSLALLHARRVVHRDVTPRNVRLTREGHCKLLDFGALAEFGESSGVIGTPPAVPPEVLDGEALDQRVDLYALGALAYFMLTGHHAYPAGNTRQLPSYWARPPEPPSLARPERDRSGERLPPIPAELDRLVLWLLNLDRAARPASASVVIDRIDAILGHEAHEERDLAESYLSSAPTVGREEDLAEFRGCLDQLARGRGAALLITGPAGSGKSRLLSDLVLEARLRGLAVVRADAALHERPYSTAHALCRELLEVAPSIALECARPHAAVLAHVLPELSQLLAQEPVARPADPLLWRTRLQSALHDFLLALGRELPFVMAVDNLQRCDHASAVVLAALAREVKHARLLVAVALSADGEVAAAAPCQALQELARTRELAGLTAREMQSWFESLFGDAPNLPRLSRFLHDHTGGNPGDCMELLRFLVRSGALRYRDGTWVLPSDPGSIELPEHVEDAVQRRLAILSPSARSLARALSMYRGAMTVDLCRTLIAGLDELAVRASLDELLAHGVLTLGRDGYGFAHDVLREALRNEIAPEERARLHRSIAEAILARPAPHVSERFEAALHLVEAGEERGVEMLRNTGVTLSLRYDGLLSCMGSLERAIELCRARGRSDYDLAPLLASIALAAYVGDRRLDRHSPDVVACFENVLGLALAQRLRPLLGRRASALLGLGWGALRHALLPRRKRPGSFIQLVQMFVTAVTALCGKAAICLDQPQITKLSAALEPLCALGPRSAGAYAYDYCRGLGLVMADRHTAAYTHWLGLERRLFESSGLSRLPLEGRRLWDGGVNYVLGVFDSLAGDPKALERAQHLDDSEIDIHQLVAAQIRLQYHGLRGEVEQSRRAFADLEACAVRSGSTWQVQTWAAVTVNLTGTLLQDLMMTKRSLDETERLAPEIPSLARYAQSSKGAYLLLRGQPRECIDVLERMFQAEAPFERTGWSPSRGLLADAYNRSGQHERARQICEHVFEHAEPEDARYSAQRLMVEVAYAFALASLGEFDAAERHLSQQLELHAAHASPLVLGTLHETAARIALMRKDRKSYSRHLKEVERWFCPLGNPPLIARFRQLTELGGSDGGVAAKIASMREVRAFDSTLTPLTDRKLAASHIFTWLMQKCDGYRGYLLVQDAFGLSLLCSSNDDEPPLRALELVDRSLQSLGRDAETTEGATEVDEGGGAFHVHLLSFVENDGFFGEGALVLHGQSDKPPRIRYDLLQVAARHLHRLRPRAGSGKGPH